MTLEKDTAAPPQDKERACLDALTRQKLKTFLGSNPPNLNGHSGPAPYSPIRSHMLPKGPRVNFWEEGLLACPSPRKQEQASPEISFKRYPDLQHPPRTIMFLHQGWIDFSPQFNLKTEVFLLMSWFCLPISLVLKIQNFSLRHVLLSLLKLFWFFSLIFIVIS